MCGKGYVVEFDCVDVDVDQQFNVVVVLQVDGVFSLKQGGYFVWEWGNYLVYCWDNGDFFIQQVVGEGVIWYLFEGDNVVVYWCQNIVC